MRNLFLTIGLALFAGSLFAHDYGHSQNHNSDLNVKMWDNSTFSISLDDSHFTSTTNFKVKNIAPGSHYVKIIKKKKQHNGYGVYMKSVVYEGNINIPSNRKILVKVEGRNRLNMQFFKKFREINNGSGHGSCSGSNNHNNGHGNGVSNNNHGYSYGHTSHSQNFEMSNSQFDQLIRIVKSENFDSEKLIIAKQALANNYVSVDQIGVIMDELTFDSAKLDFSKVAYSKAVDKENYFVVMSKFTFSSNANKLNEYISHITV